MPTIELVKKTKDGKEVVICSWLGMDYYGTYDESRVHTFSEYFGRSVPEGSVIIDFSRINPHNEIQILVITLVYKGQTLVNQKWMYLSHRGRGGLSVGRDLFLRMRLNSPLRDPNWERDRINRKFGKIVWKQKPDRHIHNHDFFRFLAGIDSYGFEFGEYKKNPWWDEDRNWI